MEHWSKNLNDLNVMLNSLTTCCLIFGYWQIKKGNKEIHIKAMLSAFGISILFLTSYLTYHYFHGDTKFVASGLVRPLYFFILITHVILSIVNLPLVLTTMFFAFKKNHEKHKKFAKITLPIWLYVSVSGILVYLFLEFLNN